MKKEPCRNFQRGSCQYGERCKFLHVTPQQPKSNASGFGAQANSYQQPKSNPFGFGAQANSYQQPKSNPFGFGTQANSHQQQKPNPFGFGVQSNPQSKGANNFGNQQNQFKNTWTRPTGNGAPSSRLPDNQSQATNHKCTDPESCKRIIAEDFANERPLWKLTCYGHWRNSPCDISGDVSYEELRATAYDDAKRGLSMQTIVERERNLLNSKLAEFESFLHNPYTGPAGSKLAQVPFPAATTAAFSPTAQNSATSQNSFPPSVSSFSQLGASLNTGFPVRPTIQSNTTSGQPISFSNSARSSSVFATQSSPSVNAFSFGSQQPNQQIAASFTTNKGNFGNSNVISAAHNQFSSAAQNLSSSSVQPPALFDALISKSVPVGQAANGVQNNLPTQNISGDSSIWLKEKWNPGEIPEEAPPDALCT